MKEEEEEEEEEEVEGCKLLVLALFTFFCCAIQAAIKIINILLYHHNFSEFVSQYEYPSCPKIVFLYYNDVFVSRLMCFSDFIFFCICVSDLYGFVDASSVRAVRLLSRTNSTISSGSWRGCGCTD